MPILNILVILLVAFVAYMWSQQGLFSAFLHLVCTIVAGAIAFAFWEPIAYLMIAHVREDIAWSVSLVLPFLLSLLGLRLLADRLISANVHFPNLANVIGGGLCGALSGVISVGFLVLGVGLLRLPSDFLGYKPINYDPRGSLTRVASLWVPVDRAVAGLYEAVSAGGLATASPLAHEQPDVHEQAALLRITFEDKGRTTLSPDDITVRGRYTVKGDRPSDLFADSFFIDSSGQPGPAQPVKDLAGADVGPGGAIEGFVIDFGPGAKEKGGQIVMGQGQVRLIARGRDGSYFGVQPFAVIGQADGATVVMSRFRYDAKDIFIGTPAGPSNATVGLEFALPPGAEPHALLVKNVRVPIAAIPHIRVPDGDPKALTVAQRDAAIRARALVTAADDGSADAGSGSPASGSVSTAADIRLRGDDPLALEEVGVRLSSGIPNAFNKSNRGGLELNEDNRIVDGEATLGPEAFGGTLPSSLRVANFAGTGDTEIVQLVVSFSSRISYLVKTLDLAESVIPPILVDVNGQQYQAIGYIHDSPQGTTIRFTPGDPIRGYGQIPMPSRSKPDDHITLVFRVSKGAEIISFNLGPKAIVRFDPRLRIPR